MFCLKCGFTLPKGKRKFCSKKCSLIYWQETHKDQIKAYRNKTKDKRNARRMELYHSRIDERERVRAKVKEWQEKNPLKRKAQRIKKFGITVEEFNKMLENQKYRCAICGYDDISDPKFFPVVDHCHTHNQVRGLLCMNCNLGLGSFRDNPDFLDTAILYLREASWKRS